MNTKVMMMAIAMIGVAASQVSAQDIADNNAQQPQNKMYQPREFTEWAFEGVLMDMDQQTRIDSLNNAVKAKAQARATDGQNCKKECKKAANGQCDKAKNSQCDKAKNGQCDKANGQCDKANGQCDKAKNGQCDKANGQCDKAKNGQCDKAKNGPKSNGMMIKGGPRDKQKARAPRMQHAARYDRSVYDDEYIAKVKEILTPEQYTIFLENIVEQPVKMQKGRVTDLRPGDNARMPQRMNREARQVRGIH